MGRGALRIVASIPIAARIHPAIMHGNPKSGHLPAERAAILLARLRIRHIRPTIAGAAIPVDVPLLARAAIRAIPKSAPREAVRAVIRVAMPRCGSGKDAPLRTGRGMPRCGSGSNNVRGLPVANRGMPRCVVGKNGRRATNRARRHRVISGSGHSLRRMCDRKEMHTIPAGSVAGRFRTSSIVEAVVRFRHIRIPCRRISAAVAVPSMPRVVIAVHSPLPGLCRRASSSCWVSWGCSCSRS